MYKGERKYIYQKPLTMEDFEGVARLVEKISESKVSEYWKVKFEDGSIVNRVIAKD